MTTSCPLCSGKNQRLYFDGPLRSGTWGNWTQDSHKILQCADCSLVFLEKAQIQPAFYESHEYRKTYGVNEDLERVRQAHAADDRFHLNRIGLDLFKSKVVADVGAGAGGFLELIRPLASKAIAVEPDSIFRKELGRHHQTAAYAKDLLSSAPNVDVATSFNVLEHVSDPLQFLRDIHDILRPGGQLYLVTPNLNDLLGKILYKDFSRYFFRTAHLYYFSEASLRRAMELAGFRDLKISFIHKYDFKNLLQWLLTRAPKGEAPLPEDFVDLTGVYETEVERKGLSSHILISGLR